MGLLKKTPELSMLPWVATLQTAKKNAVVAEDRGGRHAVTHWQVAERLGNFSLLRFRLETGRTHQIRVHSAHMGMPVVGDPTYGSGRDVGVNLPGAGPPCRTAGTAASGHGGNRWLQLPPYLPTSRLCCGS